MGFLTKHPNLIFFFVWEMGGGGAGVSIFY